MGCGSSKPSDAPPTGVALTATGGGSMILSNSDVAAASGTRGSGGGATESLIVSKGGSYIMGRQVADWKPGQEIMRPSNTISTQYSYINVGPNAVLRIAYAVVSEQGRSSRPPQKPNQDSFVCIPDLAPEASVSLFGVFDGHGPRGEDASNFCRIYLPDAIVSHPTFNKSPFEALRASFEITHRRFISPSTATAGVDTAVSGSTAIAVMFRGNQYVCANVGDSRAMIASETSKGTLIARPLSIDHKPTRSEERSRIQSSSGKILSEAQLGIDGGDPTKYYICRVYNGVIRYGVLFTRSIGDADGHAHLGLSAAPELKTGRIDPKDRFMVLATDGVWDFLNEEDVARLVDDADGDAQIAVANVTQSAKSAWDRESDRRRDDITAVVLMFKHMTLAEAEEDQKARASDFIDTAAIPDAHAAAAGDAAMRALPDVDVAPDARAPDAATMAQLEAGVDATSPTMLILNSGMPATVENTSLATSLASGSTSDAITAPPPSGSTNLHVLSEGVIAEDVIGATTPATA